jgi:hypothetical protein
LRSPRSFPLQPPRLPSPASLARFRYVGVGTIKAGRIRPDKSFSNFTVGAADAGAQKVQRPQTAQGRIPGAAARELLIEDYTGPTEEEKRELVERKAGRKAAKLTRQREVLRKKVSGGREEQPLLLREPFN